MAKRSWYIPTENGEVDRDALVDRLLDLVTCVSTAGGAAVFGVDRREVAPGEYETGGVFVQYNTFVQATHLDAIEEPDTDDSDRDPGEEDGEDEVTGEGQEQLVAAEAVVE